MFQITCFLLLTMFVCIESLIPPSSHQLLLSPDTHWHLLWKASPIEITNKLDRNTKTLAGSSGDDQSASRFSGTMKLFPDLGLCICESMNKISLLVLFWYQEFARSDWMGLLAGDKSERINSSHSIIDNFSTCQNNFSTCQNNFSTCERKKWKKIFKKKI